MTAIARKIQSDRAAYHNVVSDTTVRVHDFKQTALFSYMAIRSAKFQGIDEAHVDVSILYCAVTSHLLKKSVL